MKKLLFACLGAVLLLFMFNSASAQTRFGVKAGLNLANISGDDTEDTKMLPTFLIGGQAEFGLSDNLGLGVGLQLSGKGFKLDVQDETFASKPFYLQVPVQLIYRNSGFFAGAGPYVGFGLFGKNTGGDEDENLKFGNTIEDSYAPLDFGAGLELGYEFSSLRVTASYNLGLSNIIPKDVADAFDSSAKHNVIGISLAYLFGGE